jgi:hypothetical protein
MAVKQSKNTDLVSGWVGWIGFASFLLLFTGFFHIIQGLADLGRHEVFTHASAYVWIFDYTKWGWINIIGGILLIVAALSLLKGGIWGRVFGGIVVILSMLASASSMPIYPIWSILVLIVDGLILYAIAVHGKELED